MKELYQLNIKPEFKRLVLPLSLKELFAMEDAAKNGIGGPVRIWYNNILVDFEYYEYCHIMGIPFETERIHMNSYEEAIEWICETELKRTSLTDEMRKYLIGERSQIEQTLGKLVLHRGMTTNRRSMVKTPRFDMSAVRTREKIGLEYHIGAQTVRKYEMYAKALDFLNKTESEFVEQILAGKVKLSHEKLDALVAEPAGNISALCREIMASKSSKITMEYRQRMKTDQIEAGNTEKIPKVSIKDMPKYDPDAELSSLALTIPSWISSIRRAWQATDMEVASADARERIMEALLSLEEVVSEMTEAVMEVESDGRLQ